MRLGRDADAGAVCAQTRINGPELPLMLTRFQATPPACYRVTWHHPDRTSANLGDYFRGRGLNSHASSESSQFEANVDAYAVTAFPYRVRPLCQFSRCDISR